MLQYDSFHEGQCWVGGFLGCPLLWWCLVWCFRRRSRCGVAWISCPLVGVWWVLRSRCVLLCLQMFFYHELGVSLVGFPLPWLVEVVVEVVVLGFRAEFWVQFAVLQIASCWVLFPFGVVVEGFPHFHSFFVGVRWRLGVWDDLLREFLLKSGVLWVFRSWVVLFGSFIVVRHFAEFSDDLGWFSVDVGWWAICCL